MSRPSRTRGLKPPPCASRQGSSRSRPSRTRGLKHDNLHCLWRVVDVASFTDAWIETGSSSVRSQHFTSRPSRTRGLKPLSQNTPAARQASRPSRTRGLKHALHDLLLLAAVVASFTDAWIETGTPGQTDARHTGRVLHGRVD